MLEPGREYMHELRTKLAAPSEVFVFRFGIRMLPVVSSSPFSPSLERFEGNRSPGPGKEIEIYHSRFAPIDDRQHFPGGLKMEIFLHATIGSPDFDFHNTSKNKVTL